MSSPLPPFEMRQLVGPTDPAKFSNDSGELVFPLAGELGTRAVLDFGCGCGRDARRLMMQQRPPERYVGLDLHRGMIRWAQQNLTPHAPQFRFQHHDAYNPGLNTGGSHDPLPFDVPAASFSLVLAQSVFTHVPESLAIHYLTECARAVAEHGMILTSWFLFDKDRFPMLQEFQNALYINEHDPTNAVIYDRGWLKAACEQVGLVITNVEAPRIHGYHWKLCLRKSGDWTPLPADTAPYGSSPPPVPSVLGETIG